MFCKKQSEYNEQKYEMDKLSVLYLSLINKASNKIATARNIGKEEGLAEGEYKARIENAKKMLADGLSINMVAKYTGLSIEKVKDLI